MYDGVNLPRHAKSKEEVSRQVCQGYEIRS